MADLLESYPKVGTEAVDRLGSRLALRVETVPKQIQQGEQIRVRFQFQLDGSPLATLSDWPSENECESLEYQLIPLNHFVAQVGLSGPAPQSFFNESGRAFQADGQTYHRTFETKSRKQGSYNVVIVAAGKIAVGNRQLIVVRRLEISLRILEKASLNPSFWVIEHVSRAWSNHVKTAFFRIENGAVKAQTDKIVLPMLSRAPGNLLIAERLFDFDEKTADVYTAHVPTVHTFDQELRRIRADGQVQAISAIPGLDTKRLLTLAVDGANRRLWLALPTSLVAVSLDNFSILSRRENVIAPTMAVDPFSGELWAGAYERKGAGQAIYGLKRYGLKGDPTVDIKNVTIRPGAPHSGLVPLNDGGVMVIGWHEKSNKYLRIGRDGKIQGSSDALDKLVVQFGVNPENGQIWESVLVQGRIPTLQRRSENFSAISQFGLTELGFSNLFGVDYVPALNAAVVAGNRKFSVPPPYRGQLAKITDQGVIEAIAYSGNRMAIVKSVR